MPLDPSIFYNFAALRQNQAQNQQAQLANAIQGYREQKRYEQERANKGLDLDALAQKGAMEYATTGQISPEGLAAIKAKSLLEGPKVTYQPDAEGNVRAITQPSLWDRFQQMGGGGQYQPSFPPIAEMGGTAPLTPVDRQPMPPMAGMDGMNFPAIDMAQLEMQMARGPSMPPPAPTVYGPENPVYADAGQTLPQIQLPQIPGAGEKTQQAIREAAGKAAVDTQKELGVAAGKAKIEKQAAMPKAEANLVDLGAKMKNMNATIDQAINQSGAWSAGLGSSVFGSEEKGYLAGSPPANLAATLKTIKADAAFSELQKMRDNSPTGGALGGIAIAELQLLESAQAALAQSQSPEQLKENLQKYKDIRNESLIRVRDAFVQQYGYEPNLSNYGVPPFGAKQIGTSGGKAVYQLPDGSYIKEQ